MYALVLAPAAAGAFLGIVIYVAIVVFLIASLWFVFVKAGRPGWAAIIPFYSYCTCSKWSASGMVADPLPHPLRGHRRLDHRGDRLASFAKAARSQSG